MYRSKKAFTLVELLIYAAVFSVASTVFLGVFFAVTNIQNREVAGVEVGRQLDFVLQNIQRLVRGSSAVEMDSGVVSSNLKLRTSLIGKDPTLIYLSNNFVYSQEGISAPVALTNNKVKVQTLEFEKIINEAGHDTVRINILISYNADNPKLRISRNAQLTVPRIGTVTFDSDIVPTVTKMYSLGSLNNRWRDVSVAQDFLGSDKLMIGTSTPVDPYDYVLVVADGRPALRVASSGRIILGDLFNLARLNFEPQGSRGALYYNTLSNKFRAYQDNAWVYFVQAVTGTDRWELSGADIFATKEKSGQPLKVSIPNNNPGSNDLSVLGKIYSTTGGFKLLDGVTLSSGKNTVVSTSSNETVLINNGYTNSGSFVQPAENGSNWYLATAVPWSARRAHASVVFNNKIWVMGGGDATNPFLNDVWSSVDGINWVSEGIASWSPRSSFVALVFNSKIWVMGGSISASPFAANDVWSSIDGRTWILETGAAPWAKRNSFAAVVNPHRDLGVGIWLIGGYTDTGITKNDVWFSANGAIWTGMGTTSFCPPRSGHTALSFSNKVWVFGGVNGGTLLNNVCVNKNDFSDWGPELDPPWSLRDSHASVVLDNKMWVLGGRTQTSFASDVWYATRGLADYTIGSWTQATPAASWAGRALHSAVVFNNKMWVMGGDLTFTGTYKNDVWYARSYPATTYYWYQK